MGVIVFLMVLLLFRKGELQVDNCAVDVENDASGVKNDASGVKNGASGIEESGRPCDRLWEKHMKDYRKRYLARMAEIPNGDGGNELFSYDAFEPEYNCPIENRVGLPFGDGGKFLCGSSTYYRKAPKGLVYSIGSNGVFDFENEVIHELACEVHTFDPTGDTTTWSKLAGDLGINYHPIGLAAYDGDVKIDNVTCRVQ